MIRLRTRWYLGDNAGCREAIAAAAVEAARDADPALRARAEVELARRWIVVDPNQVDPIPIAERALEACIASGIPTARARMILGLAWT